MSSIAILDLGTNTFQLLIANIIDNKPVLVFEESIAVKLGEGGGSKKAISARQLLIVDFQQSNNSKNQ